MTGLDLESFLHLLRADLGAWASLGLVLVVLGLMTWTSWGSRKALRKCLVLSIAAHVGLVLYGSTFPIVLSVLSDEKGDPADTTPVHVQLTANANGGRPESGDLKGPDGRTARAVALWDKANDPASLGGSAPKIRPEPATTADAPARSPLASIGAESVVAEVASPKPTAPSLAPATGPEMAAPNVAPGDPAEVAAAVASRRAEPSPAEAIGGSGRVKPDRVADPVATAAPIARPDAPGPSLASPLLELPTTGPSAAPARTKPDAPPIELAQADPSDVAAPRPGPKPTGDVVPSGAVAMAGADARTRTRREAAPSSGSSTIAMLAPRTAAAPLAPSVTTVAPPPLEAPAVASRPTGPAPARPVAAPTTVAADATGIGFAETKPTAAPTPREALPQADLRRQSRPGRDGSMLALNDRKPDLAAPASLPRVSPSGMPGLPAIAGATGLTRPPADVPAVYRSRLDPNRFAIAQKAGASRESEQSVERALDWLRRHQDPDGRWDGGTAKYKDGTVAEGDNDYTAHCPPGDVCFGECYYWEADTALTGLALLAYLGAGYTHLDGQYADTVARGLEYLRLAQKSDGDLRGRSQAVGMYCHAMATLALCEAYALTSDPKLRGPVEKAVAFLVKSRAKDGMAWRYAPGAPVGDTSILGWVVMVLKSAQEVGIPIPSETKAGISTWLDKVASGPSKGLAKYQPWEKITPTMTAEAWVCRQFLGVGGPGAASGEAAEYLLKNPTDRVEYNLYYWYYGTLAMYQQGGAAWSEWNAQARDQIVRRQRLKGHATGSWDPDASQYGTHGGRIYCTALATLSLEVYYRYLPLYHTPATTPLPATRSADGGVRRTEAIAAPAAPAR